MTTRKRLKHKREIGRIGVIDVGSNSVRLVVFDGDARAPAYFYDEKVMCGLGRNLTKTGLLNPDGKYRALAAINRFSLLAKSMNLTKLIAVGTAAVREAKDGPQFCDQIYHEFGVKLKAISGEEEAIMSARGVLLGWPHASGLVCDIGGSSMELAALRDGEIKKQATSALGPLSIMDTDPDERDHHIQTLLAKLACDFQTQQDQLFLVGGSWRAIARFQMQHSGYPLHVLHDYRVKPRDLVPSLLMLKHSQGDQILAELSISETRKKLLPIASAVLLQVLEHFKVAEIAFSSYGLREGVYLSEMHKAMVRLDPLIEACRAEEELAARFPGFGDVLFEWLLPIFGEVSDQEKRLIHAACLLHDVNWRTHPDYRAEVCFESATHANLSGIGHKGRVFLAFALLCRYKSKSTPALLESLRDLLSPEDHQKAQVLGRAMRLGAMMNGAKSELMGKLSLQDDTIYLDLNDEAASLYGEIVQKRLRALADVMEKTAIIRTQ